MSSDQNHLIVRSEDPFNAEPKLDRLRARSVTSAADFYVRSHGNVPEVDTQVFRLRVSGRVRMPLELSLDDLRRQFKEHEVEAVLQCAGNRREDLNAIKPVTGDPWAPGAIGNARWSGVRLADVLEAAEAEDAAHVAFSSMDGCFVDGKTFHYGVSIPMEKAASPEVLLAYAMNGEPLQPEHGYPLRLIVPGYAGVRSPKWVQGIEVQDVPSDNPMQAEDYKMLPPDIERPEDIDWDRGITINEMPLNSAICEPAAHASLTVGKVAVRGYAMATDREIARVDISIDGGETWTQAKLDENENPWCWTFWSTDVELTAGRYELVVRAWDAAGQTQPASLKDTWNLKGYLASAWHRVSVTVV